MLQASWEGINSKDGQAQVTVILVVQTALRAAISFTEAQVKLLSCWSMCVSRQCAWCQSARYVSTAYLVHMYTLAKGLWQLLHGCLRCPALLEQRGNSRLASHCSLG